MNTEIIYAEWTHAPTTLLYPRIKAMRRILKKSDEIKEKRLLEKEIGVLARSHKGFSIAVCSAGKQTRKSCLPALGAAIAALDTINEGSVRECIAFLASQKELTSMDVDSFLWQAKFVVIEKAVCSGGTHSLTFGACAAKLGELTLLDSEKICRELNPLDRVFAQDPLYTKLTSETKALYRKMTAEMSTATGINESRLSREYVARADRADCHIGVVINDDYRRVFRLMTPSRYIALLLSLSAALTVLVCGIMWNVGGSIHALWLAAIVYLPAFAVVKPVLDLSVSKTIRAKIPLPQIDLKGEIPDNARTLCVISTLLTAPDDVAQVVKKLDAARLKNTSGNLHFCALCDFKANKYHTTADDDEPIIQALHKAFADTGYTALVRKREYSETSRCFQGRERKRGAIESLMKLLRPDDFPNAGEDFAAVTGDTSALADVRYVAALDYDTVPLMDSISELVGIARHPCHKGVGIIVPRITTTLASSLKTGFSRAMAGNGGCAGASSYDSFSGEFYQDCFGEGIFTGKGLLDVDVFIDACCSLPAEGSGELVDVFPSERILSHDILEGGLCGVAYAGDVEFSDSFPETSNAYFKRLHRWLRGDLQNIWYMFDDRFTLLTRFKLFDNVRRAVTPPLILLCFFAFAIPNASFTLPIEIVALAAVVLPFLTGFLPSVIRGRKFSNYRRFYSPVLSQTKQLLRQCLMELLLLPKHAAVSLDATGRVLWRTNVSKRRLLDWTTAAALDGKFGKGGFGAVTHMLWALILSAVLFALAVVHLNVFALILSVLFLSALPVVLFCDKTEGETKQRIPEVMRKDLSANARQIWQFYEDYVTETHNFLPPDNVQYSPVQRVAARTSPTNIGMYLLSCVAAYVFGFVDKVGLESRIERTLATIEKLHKWNGNLCNWYTTDKLEVISEFVSSVDSGNYVCCLVAVNEALKHENCTPTLIARMDKQIDETNLVPFYNEARNLFSIGYDMDADKLSHHHYDLLMSESRMLSYYAIASGQANKRHWRCLGRVMGKKGKYAAPVAWTGTMFEYFMPELLLSSKEGSMEYEALKFCLHCQQAAPAYAPRGIHESVRGRVSVSRAEGVKKAKTQSELKYRPFGISESGFYAFDRSLNYQYKAHGVQDIGLKAGLNREYVVSPYSTFLALSYDPIGCYNNLAKMEKLGLCHERYGFYEAADFTQHRVGSGYAVVKSHMAHHMGMSICAIANTLCDGILQKLFMTNEKMKRAGELMEEKIIAGEPVLGAPERQDEQEMRMNADILASGFNITNPRLNVLSNGQISVITSDIGVSQTLCDDGKAALFPSCDLYNPRGSLCAFIENEDVYAFYNHPKLSRYKSKLPIENCVVFTQNTSEYLSCSKTLKTQMDVFLDEAKPVEIRSFRAVNKAAFKRNLTLACYLEPALAREKDVLAHPAFMDLFIKLRFDEQEKLFIASRKERDGNDETVMAIGFAESDEVDFTFSFNREQVISRNGGIFSMLTKARDRTMSVTDVPAPCILIKADFVLDAHEKKAVHMFTCYGNSADETIALAREIRATHKRRKLEPSEEIISPLVSNTIYGRITRRYLGNILYTPQNSATKSKAVLANKADYREMWKYGISGDVPIVLYKPDRGAVNGADVVIEMKKALTLCRIEYDLVMLYDNDKQRALYEEIRGEIHTEAYLLDSRATPQEDINLLNAVAALTLNSGEILQPVSTRVTAEPPELLPLYSCAAPPISDDDTADEAVLDAGAYVAEQRDEYGAPPWSNVLANSRFGTLVTDRALGFTWALNSRECKLTPWVNDLRADNRGELLVLKTPGGLLYDLIDGSRATFAPNKVDYAGVVGSGNATITANTSVRVYSRGMGKRVVLELTNHTDTAQKVQVAYYTEPILGVDGNGTSAKLIKTQVMDNTLVMINPANGTLSGAMTLSCDKRSRFVTDKAAFWSGDWDSSKSGGIGAVIIPIDLPPKRSEKIKFILSFTQNIEQPLTMEKALRRKKSTVVLPAKELNTDNTELAELYKHWIPWQVVGCRIWARTGFYQNSGAYGFRDQLQDCLAAVKINPQIAKTQILRCCCAQFPEGDVLHWWHDLLKIRKGVRTRYSDDLLWLPYVLADYIEQTGDKAILDIKTRYCTAPTLGEKEHERYGEVEPSELKETVYQHAKRALEKADNTSDRGLLLIGGGDWCDGYNRVGADGKGESVWLCMFYAMTAKKFAKLAQLKGDVSYSVELEGIAAGLIAKVDDLAWDGEHYLRAFYDDETPMGSNSVSGHSACKIDLLPQAFAVLAEMPQAERVNEAMNSALRELYDADNRIIKLFTPPFNREEATTASHDPGYVQSYPPGVRENGGQYSHAAVWLALACHRLGMKDKARELAEAMSPAGRNKEYKTEPYYLVADIYTNPKAYGRGGWSIYTGSAGWYYRTLAEIYGEKE
ncbi:MAG: hypothetical protein FWG45_00365 [Oscillospiraceae bacterium]|nr:hypothetical protein [Oscillospiraceae bacterium]